MNTVTRNDRRRLPALLLTLTLAAGGAACSDEVLSTGPDGEPEPAVHLDAGPPASTLPAPSGLATVALGAPPDGELELWPFTGSDLPHDGNDATAVDPVNLIFPNADPRGIRSALLALDGNRSGPLSALDCTWADAFGGVQTAYTGQAAWVGSSVQLQCGDYAPVRFHLRLFRAGAHTLGGAHFEVLIPGTTDHQVLSWELAEQVVVADLARAGILAGAPSATDMIHPAPGFRVIPSFIYNGLPPNLIALIGGPAQPVAADVGIATDGRATVVPTVPLAPSAGSWDLSFTIPFDQVIPRPFCSSGPGDLVAAVGQVDFVQRVRQAPSGTFTVNERAEGMLTLRAVDPATMVPVGEPWQALVSESHEVDLREESATSRSLVVQTEAPPVGPAGGQLRVQLQVGPAGSSRFERTERCSP